MKLTSSFFAMAISKIASIVSLAAFASSRLVSSAVSQASSAIALPQVLGKRDAYTCYGKDANMTDCQAALDQLQLFGDQDFEVYSGICLNWSQDTCNVRFCAQPYVTKTVNRTASWIYEWASNALVACVRDGQYSLMGDSLNLNGNGGTYRLYIENSTPGHGEDS
ncbi:hypothetical protein O1611_g4108 [Lasiodiplodia mahajangana]|uniref:Uncharacterized protein n=1 Tax=Lasiodiplodia mahajangana TaxID=1108764 RepID=A0ACC2JQJ6_9PEZI|nr:hypothetical protein O1611_g4108 [Lasiodiplodia mahajangana]